LIIAAVNQRHSNDEIDWKSHSRNGSINQSLALQYTEYPIHWTRYIQILHDVSSLTSSFLNSDVDPIIRIP